MPDVRNNVKPEDTRFIVNKPDPGFSPERNKAIIEQSIKDYEAMRAKKVKSRVDEYMERSDAVVSYLKHLSGHGEKRVDQYFSKRELARLRGDEIRERLMAGMTVKTMEGEIIKRGN